jgi:hypothetical protein
MISKTPLKLNVLMPGNREELLKRQIVIFAGGEN